MIYFPPFMLRSTLRLLAITAFLIQVPAAFAKMPQDIPQLASGATHTLTTQSDSGTELSVPPTDSATAIRPSASYPQTRAGFTAMLVDQLYSQKSIDDCFWNIASKVPPTFTLVFTDVRTNAPYAKEICVAMRDGIIRGYRDGSFHPGQPITFADAAKMISRAYSFNQWPDETYSNPWFNQYVETLAVRNAIPTSIHSFDQQMTSADMQEILQRLAQNITNRPSTPMQSLESNWADRFPPVVIVHKQGSSESAASSSSLSSEQMSEKKSTSSKTSTSQPAGDTSSASSKSYTGWFY